MDKILLGVEWFDVMNSVKIRLKIVYYWLELGRTYIPYSQTIKELPVAHNILMNRILLFVK
jgi:hypothetical protein